MPSTLKYGITYPAGNVAPNVPLAMQSTAESAEAAINTAVAKIRHAEYTSSITTGAGTLYDPGVFTADAALTTNNTFVVPDVTGKIKFTEAGVYAIHLVTFPTANPGNAYGLIKSPTGTTTHASSVNSNATVWEITLSIPNYRATANEILWFRIQTANAVATTSRLKITKVQG